MEFSKIKHIDGEKSVGLTVLPNGHIILTGVIAGDCKPQLEYVIFSPEAISAIGDLIDQWKAWTKRNEH